jgi:thioredoxin reductase (NADPH)
MQHFNIEEILKIAVKIEQNGRSFYLEAAQLVPEHSQWLNRLADEEIAHEHVFEMFAQSLVSRDDAEPSYEDAEDLAMAYLHSIADSIIFDLAKDPRTSFSENPTIDEIIEDALRREHDAVLFYTGIRNVMTDPKSVQEIDLIIREEMGHVAWLKEKQNEIHEENLHEKEFIYEVAVIGGGPGGISLGAELTELGLAHEQMAILEGSPKTSWIIRKLYPDQKLVTANYKGVSGDCHGVMKMRNMTKDSALQMLSEAVVDFNLPVFYDHAVLKIEKNGDLFHIETKKETIKARFCVIAIGVFGKPNRPDYTIPRSLKAKTSFDITSTKILNQEVLVVGGGDSASEYVQHLLMQGNKVSLSSREKDLSYMNDDNRRITTTQGLSGEINLYAGSDVEKIEDESGKIRVIFKGNEPSPVLVDRMVFALGGTTPINFLKISGIEMDGNNPILTSHHETTVPGLYITGDLAAKNNSGAIATAFNVSNDVARHLESKLSISAGS